MNSELNTREHAWCTQISSQLRNGRRTDGMIPAIKEIKTLRGETTSIVQLEAVFAGGCSVTRVSAAHQTAASAPDIFPAVEELSPP